MASNPLGDSLCINQTATTDGVRTDRGGATRWQGRGIYGAIDAIGKATHAAASVFAKPAEAPPGLFSFPLPAPPR